MLKYSIKDNPINSRAGLHFKLFIDLIYYINHADDRERLYILNSLE